MESKAGPRLAWLVSRDLWRDRTPALVLSAFAVLAVWFPLTNTDIWWHLAAGKAILKGGIPFVDPFTVHGQGKAWIDLHWGFQILVFGLFTLGGSIALVLAKCAVFALASWGLLKTVEAAHGKAIRPVAVMVLVILIAAGRSFVFARPIVLSLLFLTVFLYLLERFRADPDWRFLLGLPVVQMLWVNVQPLHVLGPVVLGCTLAGEGLSLALARRGLPGFDVGFDGRRIGVLALCLLAVLLAGLISPFGLDAYGLPLGLLTRIDPTGIDVYAWHVSENVPTWQLIRTGDPAASTLTWIAGVTFASFLLAWRKISLSRLALAVAFFALALMANRNLLLFYWVAGPLILLNVTPAILGHWSRKPNGLSARLLGSVMPALAAAVALGAVLLVPALEADLDEPAPFRLPVGSASVLRASGASGAVFCSVRYGGYLAWLLHPHFRPYLDGRLVLTTPASLGQYLEAVDRPADFDRLHATHRFSAVVLPVAFPDRYRVLVGHLLRHPDWLLAYTDGTEVLFVPRSSPASGEVFLGHNGQVEGIVAGLDSRFDPGSLEHEQALVHLALLLALAGQHDAADDLLVDLKGPDARAVRVRNLFLGGQLQRAEETSLGLLEEHPEHVDSLNVLALIAVQRGEPRRAVELAGRCLEVDPYNPEARAILEAIEVGSPERSSGDSHGDE